MKRICIWGTSLKKVADEAQILAATQAVKNKFKNPRITIFAQNGNYIKRYYGDISTIPTSHLKKVITELYRCDLFIIVGGPFMENRQQMISCSLLILISKVFQKPIITYGTTLFDYKTSFGKIVFGFLLNRIDIITLREEVCINILENLGIKTHKLLYPDPRYTLEPSNEKDITKILKDENIDTGKKIIGLTTRHLHPNIPEWVKRSHGYTDRKAENVYEVIGKTLDNYSNGFELVLIPMHPSYDDDKNTYEKIRRHMSNPNKLKILSRQYRILDLLGIIRSCRLVISSRLGSSIFAAATSTPHISIAYESRMIDHMNNIGLGNYVIDWRKLELDDFSRISNEAINNNDLKINLQKKVVKLKSDAFHILDVLDNY